MSARSVFLAFSLTTCLTAVGLAQTPGAGVSAIPLPSSKFLLPPVPGSPQRLNSLPMHMAASPDGRWLAVVNAGYGTAESDFAQSIALIDTQTEAVHDFADPRTHRSDAQTLYNGLAFSLDGTRLYASLDSITAPEGDGGKKTGNAIAVYRVSEGVLTPERLIRIPLQPLGPGRIQNQLGSHPIAAGKAIPLPVALAVLRGKGGGEQLLVADEFSDDVLLLDASTGATLTRFDLGQGAVTPSTYPIALAVTPDGRRAFVALWNGSAVAELDLVHGKVRQILHLMPPAVATGPGSHPAALLFAAGTATQTERLYVALANRDSVAVVNMRGHMRLAGTLDTRLPGQQLFGAISSALALSRDARTLYVANSGSDAVAVFDTAHPLLPAAPSHATGFIPTEWFPTALAVAGDHLLVATAKGKGTGPNGRPNQAVVPGGVPPRKLSYRGTYIAELLYGSLAAVDLTAAMRDLPSLSAAVVQSNRMTAAQQHLPFANGKNPIKHVIYIIKENRTYDQVFGDLPVGDGDQSLVMYGKSITPNQHKLALQFGVLDNFYDSGEVSGDGHVWSTAAITSDYTEKNWQQAYRGGERMYDYEGVVEQGYPLAEGIPDVNEPASGYLWTNLAAHGKSLYHFGEFISSKFCDDSGEAPKDRSPLLGTPQQVGARCAQPHILPGQPIPAHYGGGVSQYPWNIPLLDKNVATKPELAGHFDPLYPDFNLKFPDQLRYEEFAGHLRQWQADRAAGHDTMPAFVMLRFANDHTAGTVPGSPTPEASVADNDLAVGRAVEAISHSAYWDDTAFFILEDDAQAGADHVDAHRSLALVVSKYAPRRMANGAPVANVDHTFYTTVSTIRTMEELLGVPAMNNNDAFAPLIGSVFTGAGDQPAFTADYTNRDNRLIFQANTPKSPGAKQSSKMDFSHEDRADTAKLNRILWIEARPADPLPEQIRHPQGLRKDDDDD